MKTVQKEFFYGEDERFYWVDACKKSMMLPITFCETIEDVLSLDATVDRQQLKRAKTAHPINSMSEWAWRLAADDPNALRPDEVVFLSMAPGEDWNRADNWYYVPGSGMCFGPDSIDSIYSIPFLWEHHSPRIYTHYYINDYEQTIWEITELGFLRTAHTPVTHYKSLIPFGDINSGLRIQDIPHAPRFILSDYQVLLRDLAPFRPVEVQCRLLDDANAEWMDPYSRTVKPMC